MPLAPFPFDAVLFDLDGTLVATDRFWPDAARVGARRAFAELGIRRAMPSAAEWMVMVGLPLEEGFAQVFADLGADERDVLMRHCVQEEEAALRSGRAATLPGVTETLERLARAGIPMGIASNCGQSYLDAMVTGLGLDRWIPEARCLDSPGIADKADMIEDLLTTFGTRSAVMVGDRQGDRDAAWANGLPHVHLERGYGGLEVFACEAVLDGMDQLLPRLEGRTRWIRRTLAELELHGSAGRQRSARIGIAGPIAAGKSLFARDLARVLAGLGREARVVELEEFRRSGVSDHPGELEASHDLDRLRAESAPGPDGVVLLCGSSLQHPSMRAELDGLVYLEVSDAVTLRRVLGREGRLAGPRAVERGRERLSADRALEASCPPAAAGTLILCGDNALGPP